MTRRRWIGLGMIVVLAVVAVVLTASRSGPGSRTARLPGLTVVYPGRLHRENPIPGEQMVFLAEARGHGGQPGQSLFVRQAPGAVTPLVTDVRLLNDLQSLQHPGRRLLARQSVQVSGAVGAYELESEYPDLSNTAVTLRQIDVVARTAGGGSYHLVYAGPAAAISQSTVKSLIAGLRLDP